MLLLVVITPTALEFQAKTAMCAAKLASYAPRNV